MNEKTIEKNEFEIDIQRLLMALVDKSWLIIIVSVLCAAIFFAGTLFLITPEYQAAAKFYVNNSSISVGDASLSISSGDLVSSRGLVDSYIVILNTRETLNDVIDYAGVDRTYSAVRNMISAAAVNETEIFQVKVTSTDPYEAEKIANAIAYILPNRIGSIIEGTSAKVVEAAVVPSSPSSPSYSKNTAIGFALGLLLTVAFICLREIFDVTIRSDEDIAQVCAHPILAEVPDMAAPSKGSKYYYGYGDDRKKSRKPGKAVTKQPVLIGSNISFAASEAYKLLRTKLQFSFADENDSRVIGVSSALSGEGKSLSAVNLAFTLSELGKKVILIDCDMRRPTLAEKLGINKKPGLSSYLTGQGDLVDLVQPCGIQGDEKAFHVIAAGQNPPNPIELLSSARMNMALQTMRKVYDYIILDLPPISEVSDAMAVAKDMDGLLMVVRQNYCDRIVLGDTVRQFEFVNAKILGIVFNCTSEHSGKYGGGYYRRYYRRYYKRYYHKYGGSYEKSYAASAHHAKRNQAKNLK